MPDIFKAKNEEEKASSSKKNAHSSPSIKKESSEKPSTHENHIHALASYCTNPSFFSYYGKNLTGVLQFFIRRHVITNLPWIITTLLLLFIPPLLHMLLILTPETSGLPGNFVLSFFLLYYLIVAIYAFTSFLNWFYNIIIVTNTEILDIDYADIVYHDVAATNVNLIEDVQYVQSGFIQGLFNFGNVFVQTAGGKENIEAINVPKPSTIARFILTYIGKGELDG